MINKQMIKKIFVMIGMMSLMGGIFIAIMTYVNIGFSDEFFVRWYTSLFFAILVMMPLGGVVMFMANKVIKSTLPELKIFIQNILIGIIMALCMEAIMAIITTLNILGYPNISQFSSFWLRSYLLALPAALVISPLMTIFVKPKLDAYLAK
jgi:hypothetical protein